MAGRLSREVYRKKPRTHAASCVPYQTNRRKSPSSSKSSGYPYAATLLTTDIVSRTAKTLDFEECCAEKFQCYDLDKVLTHYLGSSYNSTRRDHVVAAECCKKVLTQFATTSCHKTFEFVTEQSLNLQHSSPPLAPLIASLEQKPDISVSLSGDCTAALIVELHSSP